LPLQKVVGPAVASLELSQSGRPVARVGDAQFARKVHSSFCGERRCIQSKSQPEPSFDQNQGIADGTMGLVSI
jgi:hypothetical protein